MGCLIRKTLISLRLGSGKTLSPWMEQHSRSCFTCRSLITVEKNLRNHTPSGIGSEKKELLTNRIINTLESEVKDNKIIKGRNFFTPAYVTAAALFLITLSIIFINRAGGRAPVKTGSSIITTVTQPFEIDNELNSLLVKIESPIQKEAENLMESIASVKQYFTTVLDFNLGI